MGFTLHFHFKPNEYFTNTVLTKSYELKCEPQDDDPFSFEVNKLVDVDVDVGAKHHVLKIDIFLSAGTRDL